MADTTDRYTLSISPRHPKISTQPVHRHKYLPITHILTCVLTQRHVATGRAYTLTILPSSSSASPPLWFIEHLLCARKC